MLAQQGLNLASLQKWQQQSPDYGDHLRLVAQFCFDPEETFYLIDTMLTMANQTGGLKHLTLLMSTSVMLSLVRESMRAK
jgi:hypothetical protein